MFRNMMVIGLALAIAGCGTEETVSTPTGEDGQDSAQEGQKQGEPLASLVLKDGTEVSFVQLDGMIAASAIARGDDIETLSQLESHLTPVEIYERLSGGAGPPARLRKAWTEVQAAIEQNPPTIQSDAGNTSAIVPDVDNAGNEGRSLGTLALSGAAFSALYCFPLPGLGWNWCYTDRTGDGLVGKSGASKSYVYFNSVSGTILVKQIYKHWITGAWITKGQTWVYTGDLLIGYHETWPATTHRVAIENASGDTWHLNFRGI